MKIHPPASLVASALAAFFSLATAHAHAPVGSGVIGLDVVSSGNTIDLLLMEEEKGAVSLRHQRSSDGGAAFAEARPIGVPGMQVHRGNRGNEPRIAASGDRLLAVWTAPGPSKWGDGPLQAARSSDGGRSWQAAAAPPDDGSPRGHGFIALAAGPGDAAHAVWLDSRDGAQGLRYARSADLGASWGPNQTIRSRTCECCWNSLYAAPDGSLAVIYRERSPRDMALAVSTDSGKTWERRSSVGEFRWDFKGCPHQGGALAWTSAEELRAVVWTGKGGKEGVHFLLSGDGGKSWEKSRPLGDKSAGHPDLAASGKRLAAVWDAKARGIWMAVSEDSGRSWGEARLVSGAPEGAKPAGAPPRASHPRVVATAGGGFAVFWTEQEPGKPAVWRKALVPGPPVAKDPG